MKTKKVLLALVAVCAMGLTACNNVDSLISKLEKTDNPIKKAEILEKIYEIVDEDDLSLEQAQRITEASY